MISSRNKYTYNLLFFLIILILIWIDYYSKKLAIENLKNDINLIWEILKLKLIHNSWVAFSFPIKWFFQIIVTYLILFLLFYQYFFWEKNKSVLIFLWYSLIIGWAIWNLIERQSFFQVTDFISLKYFAIFNFADIFISIWVLLLLIYYYQNGRSTK